MDTLGIDVSKAELVCFHTGTKQLYCLENSAEALQLFLKQHQFTPKNTNLGCESTGDYHLLVCDTALQAGYSVRLLNPILTKQRIQATVRQKKTDSTDAQHIATLVQNGAGTPLDADDTQKVKRTLLRLEQQIIRMTSDLKRVTHSMKKKQEVMDLGEAFTTIQEAQHALELCSKKLLGLALEEKVSPIEAEQEALLESVPGCGVKLAAIITAELGDIRRFPSAKQFKAYVGIDPRVRQSGPIQYTGSISKRGNPVLRYALFLAANVARRYDQDMHDFYEKKRAEGKSHRLVLCAVERKLCERIYAVLTKRTPYIQNKVKKDLRI